MRFEWIHKDHSNSRTCAMWQHNNHLDVITRLFFFFCRGIRALTLHDLHPVQLKWNNGSSFSLWFASVSDIISASWAFFDSESLRHAVQEGRRVILEPGYWLQRSNKPWAWVMQASLRCLHYTCSERCFCLCCHSPQSLHAFGVQPWFFSTVLLLSSHTASLLLLGSRVLMRSGTYRDLCRAKDEKHCTIMNINVNYISSGSSGRPV